MNSRILKVSYGNKANDKNNLEYVVDDLKTWAHRYQIYFVLTSFRYLRITVSNFKRD